MTSLNATGATDKTPVVGSESNHIESQKKELKLLFLLWRNQLTVISKDPWLHLLRETLDQIVGESGRAATGARLKAQLMVHAQEKGIEPPADFSKTKFKEWLKQKEQEGFLLLHIRDGEDLLVAPVERAELLINYTKKRSAAGIRRDLFDAFTLVSDQKPWFDPAQDSVAWTTDDSPPSTGAVRIPSASHQILRANREMFAHSIQEPSVREKLLDSLNHPRALAAFSKSIRDLKLQSEWHDFRAKSLTDAIRSWAASNGIQWGPNWIASSSEPMLDNADRQTDFGPELKGTGLTIELRNLLGLVNEEDLKRISVPLDIVLRLIGKSSR